MQLFVQGVLVLAAVASSGITVHYAAVRTMQLFVQGVLSTKLALASGSSNAFW